MKLIKNIIDYEKEHEAARLRGSFLAFMQFFYEYLTKRQFIISQPIGRESHHITLARTLTEVFNLLHTYTDINLPPGSGKSTILSMWVAWCWAHYPDSNFLYISFAHELAAKHTEFIRSILSSDMYHYLFGVKIDIKSKAKDSFRTNFGGAIKAFGSSGAVTGQDAGLPNMMRFSGAGLLDDLHKPDEVHSDNNRNNVIRNLKETIYPRRRGINVPLININHRLHEADVSNHLHSEDSVGQWNKIVIPAIDEAGNVWYPEIKSKEELLEMQDKSPYVYAGQFQQNPIPAGGALFKPEWFVELDQEPTLELTFITADTAETDKSWNDATVFSFWGLYEIEIMGSKTGKMGLHWLDCYEIRVEPADLEDEFMSFYRECMRHPTPPVTSAIEKKSTGVTLVSVLKKLRAMTIIEIERNRSSGSKTQRFIDIQSSVSSKLISFTKHARHQGFCIEHMRKITPNGTHRHDDIADTLADAIRIALIEKSLYNNSKSHDIQKQILKNMDEQFQRKLRIGDARYYGRNS